MQHDNPQAQQPSGTGVCELLDYAGLCAWLGIPRGTAHSWVHENRLPFIRLGARTVRFDRAAVLAHLHAHAVAAKRGVAAADPGQRHAVKS